MSARKQLRDALAEALPTYRVMGSAILPSAVARPTIGVWQQSMTRREEFGLNRVAVGFELWVLVGPEDPEKADDALDTALEEVLGALQPLGWVQWTEAQRGVLADNFHGYNIQVTAVAEIGD